jgi:hypothetical protein
LLVPYCTDADDNTPNQNRSKQKIIYYLSRNNQATPEEANANNPPNDHTLQASLFLEKRTKTLISEQPQRGSQATRPNSQNNESLFQNVALLVNNPSTEIQHLLKVF